MKMKKFALATFSALCFCLSAGAQTAQTARTTQTVQNRIVQTAINGDNVLQALDLLGVKMFNFDICALPEEREIILYLEERVGDAPKRVGTMNIKKRNGAEKLCIYIIPKDDSTVTFHFMTSKNTGGSFNNRKLYPVTNPNNETDKLTEYRAELFDLSAVPETPTKIPLILYGSWWWSDNAGAFVSCISPFCGSEGLADLSVKTDPKEYNVMPHYYVLGIEIR